MPMPPPNFTVLSDVPEFVLRDRLTSALLLAGLLRRAITDLLPSVWLEALERDLYDLAAIIGPPRFEPADAVPEEVTVRDSSH
jgi:hypothetical protein